MISNSHVLKERVMKKLKKERILTLMAVNIAYFKGIGNQKIVFPVSTDVVGNWRYGEAVNVGA